MRAAENAYKNTLKIKKFIMSFLMTDQYGSNNYEAAVCDMMVDSQEEIVNAIIKLMSTCKTEEEKVHINDLIFYKFHQKIKLS